MILMIVCGVAILFLGFVLGMVTAIAGLRKGLAKIGLDLDELIDLIEKIREREKEQKDNNS